MTPERVRIYDLARELGTPNKDLMNALKENLNITVKSHSSTISVEDADKLRKLLKPDASESKKPTRPETEPKTESQPEPPKQTPPVEKKEPATTPTPPSKPVQTETSTTSATPQRTTPPEPQKQQERRVSEAQSSRQFKPNFDRFKGDSTRQDKAPAFKHDPSRYRKETTNTPTRPATQPVDPASQASADASKKSLMPDRTYHVASNKYRHKPEGAAPKTETKPTRFTGRKPQYVPKHKPQQQNQQPQGQTQPQTQVQTEIQPKTQPSQRAETQQRVNFKHGKPEGRAEGRTESRPEARTDGKLREPLRPSHSTTRPPASQPASRAGGTSEPVQKPQNKPATARQPGKAGVKKEFTKKKDKYQDLKPLAEIFKKKKTPRKEVVEEIPTEVYIDSPLTIAELGEKLHISAAEIIKELMKTGIFATLNETISEELAKDVSEKLGYNILSESKESDKTDENEEIEKEEKAKTSKRVDSSNQIKRAPIVTILGHVDHGKTTLLDTIRKVKQKIVDSEIGGITQSIGAYSVEVDKNRIVFIDTPGHQAFTAMRARGAKATDIAILIVAADDGIMPQTVEAINHAKAAEVPIIVAINKIDKANAEPDKILQQLTEHSLLPEAWGGDTVTVNISAIKGDNIDELLEMITLVADLQELKADPTIPAIGVVIESELDKGKGAVARVLVQNGTLKVGDYLVVGSVGGKVRALINDMGERINEAGPSTPVEILGLSDVPNAGDTFEVLDNDKELKQIVSKRKDEEREKRINNQTPIKLQKDSIFKAKQKKDKDEIKELNIIIKADTDGSTKAVEAALQELKSKEIKVKIIHNGVGDISEADVMLAATSNAIIIGFRVKEDPNASKVSAEEGISIRTYEIIYQISEDIEKTMLGLLKPELKEIELGTAEVRDLFTIGKNLVIAGCYVLEGKIVRNRTATVLRDNKEVFKGNLDNLKRFKDDAKEVNSGYECGISFNKFNDLQKGDLIKVTDFVEVERDSLN